jgi:hypothetical protein
LERDAGPEHLVQAVGDAVPPFSLPEFDVEGGDGKTLLNFAKMPMPKGERMAKREEIPTAIGGIPDGAGQPIQVKEFLLKTRAISCEGRKGS